jgi:hypothetical protein
MDYGIDEQESRLESRQVKLIFLLLNVQIDSKVRPASWRVGKGTVIIVVKWTWRKADRLSPFTSR